MAIFDPYASVAEKARARPQRASRPWRCVRAAAFATLAVVAVVFVVVAALAGMYNSLVNGGNDPVGSETRTVCTRPSRPLRTNSTAV